jgi:autotransporter-associated beta strand protein
MKSGSALHRSRLRRRFRLASIFAAVGLLACADAGAQTLTWDTNTTSTHPQDGNGTWNLISDNWWTGTADTNWTNGDSAIFGASTAGGTVTLGTNITVGDISFDTTSPAYTIAGGGFTLTLSNTIIEGTGNGILSANLAGTGGFTVTNTGSTTGTNTIVLTGTNTALSGAITVTGAGSTTGAVTLEISGQNALGSVTQIAVDSGSTLEINVPNTTSTSLGAGTTLTIFGVGAGSGGAIQGAPGISATWNGNIILGATGARIGGGALGTLAVDGVISQASSGFSVLFSRLSGATTILNAVNTYTGDTQIYGGTVGDTATLKIGVNNAINAASDLSILATGAVGNEALDLNGFALTLRGLDTTANEANAASFLSIVNNGAAPSVLTIGDTTAANTRIFSGAIDNGSGGLSLVKINANTQILVGSSLYTGSTTVNAGTLQLGTSTAGGTNGVTGAAASMASLSYILNGGSFVINNTGASNNSGSRISDSAVFTLNGGTFLYQGSDQASTNSSETIGGITFATTASSTSATGYSTFTVQFNSTNTATVTAGSLTRSAGAATALVNGVDLGEGTGSTSSVASLLLTNTPTLVGTTAALPTGINLAATNTQIVPFLLGEVSASTGLGTATGTPNTFVTYNPTSGLRPLSLSEFATSISSGNNVYLTSSATVSATTAINSLIMGAGAGVTINSGVLTDTSGAVLFISGDSITGGTLDFGSAEGAISVIGVTGIISAKITGSDGVTIFGTGTLGLGGQSIFTGGLTLRGGVAVPQASSTQSGGVVVSGPFGVGTVTFAGSELRPTSTAGNPITIGNTIIIQADTAFIASSTNSMTFSGGVTIANGTRTITDNSAGGVVFSGAIGDGGQGFGLNFPGTGTTTLSGTSTYTGPTTISAGEVIVSGSISGSAVTVGNAASLATSAILGGSGTVGNVTAIGSGSASTSGAIVDPGNTPNVAGIMKTGALSSTNGATLAFEIGGATPGGESTTGYDQFIASGAVTLTGGNLALTVLGSPTFNSSDEFFLIINNSGGSQVSGAFGSITLNGVAVNPSDIMLGGQQFQLVYNADYLGSGSDGIANDVALVAVVVPEPSAPLLLLGGVALLGLSLRRRSVVTPG